MNRSMCPTCKLLVGCLLLSILAPNASPRHAVASEPTAYHALVIGIQDYALATHLPGVARDVRSLSQTLQERGGYAVTTVVNSARGDAASALGSRSERECLQQCIAQWLESRRPGDTIILYFSGHGFRDAANRLYLAAEDCDPKAPKPGGIPISWLRDQLVRCPAHAKLLILDACHAGSARSVRAKTMATPKELGDFFEQTEGLVTLAGCRGSQSSYLWPGKKQSIFTYWLIQGLCGNADRTPRGEITINELDDYVTRKVSRTAKSLFQADQQPTRLQGPNVTQTTLLRLNPVELPTLLDDLAEQMDVLIRLNKIDRVGVVPEFSSDAAGAVLGREYGALATQCPVDLTTRLSKKALGDYRVTSINAVRELLQSQGVRPKDLGTSKSRGIKIEGRELPALVVGRVESLQGNRFALQCQLLDLTTGDVRGIAAGTARLCASELAMQGTSGQAVPVSTAATTSSGAIDARPSDGRESARIQSGPDHPLRDPSFPYRVRIMVKGSDGEFHERRGTFRGKDDYVTLRRNEVFHIYYEKKNPGQAFVKVLVDGLNTLPEKSHVKGFDVEPVPGAQRLAAQPVSLAEALAWGPLEPNTEYATQGFYIETGEHAVFDEFKVVDAAQSRATESGYTDQLGLITVAFYEPQLKPHASPPGSRKVGVGRGDRYHTHTDSYSGPYRPGRLLAVVHIRYGERR